MNQPRLPDGLEHVRTTDTFDNDTVPAGLLLVIAFAQMGAWANIRFPSATVRDEATGRERFDLSMRHTAVQPEAGQ